MYWGHWRHWRHAILNLLCCSSRHSPSCHFSCVYLACIFNNWTTLSPESIWRLYTRSIFIYTIQNKSYIGSIPRAHQCRPVESENYWVFFFNFLLCGGSNNRLSEGCDIFDLISLASRYWSFVCILVFLSLFLSLTPSLSHSSLELRGSFCLLACWWYASHISSSALASHHW